MKLFKLFLLVAVFTGGGWLRAAEFQLSTHVLDTSIGKPGPGVKVILEKKATDGTWNKISEGVTNQDGRITDFLERKGIGANLGTYRLTFFLKEYFETRNQTTVFPEAVVVFVISDETHYHIPLVVTPYALSTYRGS